MIDRTKQAEYFEKLLEKFGPNFAALDWNSPESQELRYQVFEEIFLYGKKTVNISLLDLGCGFGDLYGYLQKKKMLESHRIKYTGYDISEKLIGVAQKRHLEATCAVKDILNETDIPQFDYIFCSGIFNIRIEDIKTHLEYVRLMLARMYDLIHCGIAVNFLSEGAIPVSDQEDLNSGRYFLFNPEKILGFCRELGCRYVLRHDYHPGDFTVFMLK